MVNAHMHISMQKPIDDMSFDELDALRVQLRLPQAAVCQLADFNPTTYGRWRRWARGEPNVNGPSRRSIKLLREILRREAARHLVLTDGGRTHAHV
jgi:hypothetical protein